MKNLVFRFTLPMSLISFGAISKWWYGFAIDAKDVFFYGFPFIYKCEGFHTSMSTQYFVLEMILNFVVYFLMWLTITYLISKFWSINISKMVLKTFWVGFGLYILGFIVLSKELDDVYLVKRNFNIKIFDNGISILEKVPEKDKYYEEVNEWFNRKK